MEVIPLILPVTVSVTPLPSLFVNKFRAKVDNPWLDKPDSAELTYFGCAAKSPTTCRDPSAIVTTTESVSLLYSMPQQGCNSDEFSEVLWFCNLMSTSSDCQLVGTGVVYK